MKKIFSAVLIVTMFIAINLGIPSIVQADSNQINKTTSSIASNITPAKGLDEEDLKNNTATATTIPKTGLENMSIIAIVVIAMIGVGSFVRAKTIKIK